MFVFPHSGHLLIINSLSINHQIEIKRVDPHEPKNNNWRIVSVFHQFFFSIMSFYMIVS